MIYIEMLKYVLLFIRSYTSASNRIFYTIQISNFFTQHLYCYYRLHNVIKSICVTLLFEY